MDDNEKKLLLAVAFDEANNTYTVDLGKGSSVPETAFVMSVVIRCLLKDGIIKSVDEVTTLITKYLTDSQYDEVQEVQDDEQKTE